MPNRTGGKKGGRKRGGNNSVVALSKSQLWDQTLARAKDACHLTDRIALGTVTTVASGAYNAFTTLTPIAYASGVYVPGSFGQRVFNIARNYARYRINRLLLCYRPVLGTTTTGIFATGFVDDPNTSLIPSISIPTVDELRCSHSDSVYREIEVEWKPIDTSLWYFTAPDPVTSQSLADYRFESPVAFAGAVGYTASQSQTLGVLQLYYDITFEGAQDPDPLG